MVAATQPEIRLRLDREERVMFERIGTRIGMSANDMVKVFIKRTIAEGGLPFGMKSPANDNRSGERFLPIFGQSHALLAEVAGQAARDAATSHIRAGRLAPSVEADASERTR
jgi:antitoxin component of RelBE/YafQ-DinJ toxin-antitoxin module